MSKYDKLLETLNRPMRDEVQVWLDVANKLTPYEEVRKNLNPEMKSRVLELVEEWKKGEVK